MGNIVIKNAEIITMFNEMRLAAIIQKPQHGPTTMDARSVFRMATIGGAKAVGMEDKIGSIEVGLLRRRSHL